MTKTRFNPPYLEMVHNKLLLLGLACPLIINHQPSQIQAVLSAVVLITSQLYFPVSKNNGEYFVIFSSLHPFTIQSSSPSIDLLEDRLGKGRLTV